MHVVLRVRCTNVSLSCCLLNSCLFVIYYMLLCILMFLQNLINFVIIILYKLQVKHSYPSALDYHFKLRCVCLYAQMSAPPFANDLITACVTGIRISKATKRNPCLHSVVFQSIPEYPSPVSHWIVKEIQVCVKNL